MSLSQVLEALPEFTFEERQILIRRVLELDEPPLSDADEDLIETRLAAHKLDPTSSFALGNIKGTSQSANEEMSWQVFSRPETENDIIEIAAWYDSRRARVHLST